MTNLKQKIIPIFVSLLILIAGGTVSFAEEFDISSPVAILTELESGQVLYEKNADKRWSPASTTKIITVLTALENATLDTEMKASSNAINSVPIDYGIAGIKPGEILTFRDLLNFVLIISANEASNVIGENVVPSGNINDFIDLMNKKADELGLKNTHFTNTYGLDEDNHYTTARDLVIAAREAMRYPIFREIVALTEVPLPDTNLRKKEGWDRWHIESTNRLLKSTSDYYDRVTGIKTGYTGKAGRCLVFSAINNEGLELIGVILGAENNDILFAEAKKLLEYGYINYKVQTLASSGEFFGRYEVADAVDNISVELQTLGTVSHLLPVSPEKLQSEVTVKEVLNTPFSAPVEKGQVMGTKIWFYNGEEIGSVQLIAMNSIEKTIHAKIRDKIDELIENNTIRNIAIIVGIIILLLIILRVILKGASRRRNYYRRNYRL
jgi:D-alanyl-D-alanine carboxypeptidase (penicillin-binding protein 5/6)